MSPTDVRRAQAAIFQPHYTRAMEAEAFARNELRMSQGLTSEPIASKAYWDSLKDDLGGQLVPFYKVVGKYYVYFICYYNITGHQKFDVLHCVECQSKSYW